MAIAAAAALVPWIAFAQAPILSRSDELVLQLSTSSHEVLADGLVAYETQGAIYLPLGELARALDLAVRVDKGGRAVGWIVRENRRFELDVPNRRLKLEGQPEILSPGAAIAQADEIFVRADLLQAWLPLTLKVDAAAGILVVTPREPLPFQERLNREARRLGLASIRGPAPPPPPEATPYLLFSLPAADINLQAATGRSNPSHYDVHVAGDVLDLTGDLYVTGDRRSAVSAVRADLGRRGMDGSGLFGVRQFAIGDVFTPELPNGERSANGRGGVVSNLAPGQSVSGSRTDIRGEMPAGWQAELYQNNVLIGSQADTADGRYTFLGVPLQFGDNLFRVVLYGPHGERRQEERRVRGEAVTARPGEFRYSLGLIQLDKPLFDVGVQDPLAYSRPEERGGAQLAAVGEYGLRPGLSVTTHFGIRPEGTQTVGLGGLGLRAGLFGSALAIDGTVADTSAALSGSLLTTLKGISLGVEHAQYWGGFRDDTRSLDNLPLNSLTTLRADAVGAIGPVQTPLSFSLQEKRYAAGGDQMTASVRTSILFGRMLASAGLSYQGGKLPGGSTKTGDLLVDLGGVGPLFGGSARISTTYAALPNPEFRTFTASYDRPIFADYTGRIAVEQGLSAEKATRVIASLTRRFSRFDGSLDVGYDGLEGGAIVGVRLSTSIGWTGRRYDFARSGLAAGGSAAIEVYEDLNGDGARQKGEPGVPGVRVAALGGITVTDKDGLALTAGLGDARTAPVIIDTGSIQDPYLRPERPGATLTARAGRRHEMSIGLIRVAEVESSVLFVGEATAPVSNVDVQAVDAQDAVAGEARSDFDGALLIENLRPGAYRIRLRPEQAQALDLTLLEAPTLTIAVGAEHLRLAPLKVARRESGAIATMHDAGSPPPAPVATAPPAPSSFVFRRALFKGVAAIPVERIDPAWMSMVGKAVALDDLRKVSARVEQIYAKLGFPFVAVLVPPQDVQGGVVEFDVVEGRISDLTVLGNDQTARLQATTAFSHLIDQTPLAVSDIEAAYQKARDIPGLTLTGSLRRGAKPGGMDLVLQAKRRTWRFYVNANNFYPKPVGPWGVLVGGEYRGASRWGDETTAQLYTSTQIGVQELARITHSRGITPWGTTLNLALLRAEAKPSGAISVLDLATSVAEGELTLEQPLVQRLGFTSRIAAGFESLDQTTDALGGAGLSHDRLRTALVRLSAHWQAGLDQFEASGEARKGLDWAGASPPGSLDLSRSGADTQAWVVRASASADLHLPKSIGLLIRFEGQYSGSSLPAPEEYGVGNLTIGRGYDPGASYGDSAAGVSLELRGWSLPLRAGLSAEPYVFFDGVRVWNVEADAPNRFVSSVGGGLRFAISDYARLGVTYAVPLERPLGLGESRPTPRILVNLTASLGEVSSSVREALTALARAQKGGKR